ncbi:MAG: mobile mystery protein B [Pirellulaceae bacterium]|nr:mobile mystery protein B [Planctomycetales bacterium]
MVNWTEVDGETPIDPSMLVDRLRGVVTNRGELIPLEAENIRKATVKYLGRPLSRTKAKFDWTWMCEVHRDMFDDVWKWAGVTRKTNLNIGIHHFQVDAQLLALGETLQYWEANGAPSTIEQAVRLHHRCAEIHPFPNGNGRWSRLLANIWLHIKKQPLVVWPTGSLEDETDVRSEYLLALRAADVGSFESLLKLHERYQSP